jgi:hypothetical protein
MSSQQRRIFVGMLVLTALAAAWGCAGPGERAAGAFARMHAPDVTPREEILLRQEIIALAPDSTPLLSRLFFPIGLYDVPEEALFDVAAAGFNVVLNGDTTPSYLSRAAACGLRVVPYIRTERMAEDVRNAQGAGPLFAWYLFDEPDLNGMAPEEYRRLSRALRDLDPARPIFLTVLSPRRYEEYAGECDIFATTVYPVRRAEEQENNLWPVAWATAAACRAARGRPVWSVVQAFFAAPTWERNPTPEEARVMAFLALNHGASGVLYFSYKSGHKPITEQTELYDGIVNLNAQLWALRGPLLTPPLRWRPELKVIDEEAAEGVRLIQFEKKPTPMPAPPIDCSLRRFGKAHLLIAVNPDPWAKTVEIALPAGPAFSRINEIYGDPEDSIKDGSVKGGRIELDFGPHDVRLFWIE